MDASLDGETVIAHQLGGEVATVKRDMDWIVAHLFYM